MDEGRKPLFLSVFSVCGAWPAFEGDFSGGLLVHRVSVDKVARAVPPHGPFGFFWCGGPCYAPPIRPALFNLRRPRRMTAGRACAVACGGRSLALAAADKDLIGGDGVGGVSHVVGSPPFCWGCGSQHSRPPGGRVAAGRGRVPPYGPQAGLGRNAPPPGVPPSPR